MMIRLITRQDLRTCAAIYAEAFAAPPYNDVWTPETAEEMLSGLLDRDPYHCWLIEESNNILGFAFCTTFGTFRGTVQEFAIAPAHQRRGLGTRLMDHILSEFQAEGIQNADLIANQDAPAYRFYRQYGFNSPRRYVILARPL
jgi:ribosomal protein S18 acetylase RimI-like enzyme